MTILQNSTTAANEITLDEFSLAPAEARALNQSCASIAPSWPLDRMIAVSPFWELRKQRFESVAAKLSALAYVHCLMPPSHYLRAWQEGAITEKHLANAAEQLGFAGTPHNLLAVVTKLSALPHWHNLSDLIDARCDRRHKISWRDEITHQISQFCAAYFQEDGPLTPQGSDTESGISLYQHWLRLTQMDRGITILMDEPELGRQFKSLPSSETALFRAAIDELGLNPERLADYTQALLLDINGWAAWVAYQQWEKKLEEDASDNSLMQSLLAVRLAWELALWRHTRCKAPDQHLRLREQWQRELAELPALIERHQSAQRPLWVWQLAQELAYQEPLSRALAEGLRTATLPSSKPGLQAVFCIDVRSEPLRRALEQQSPAIHTFGFAGFFGLPISYSPEGAAVAQPHLPGLLSPKICLRPAPSKEGARSAGLRNWRARLQEWSQSASATFSAVEVGGLAYAGKLLRRSVAPGAVQAPGLQLPLQWHWRADDRPVSTEEKVQLAHTVLKAMGLTTQFAPSILLVGHGSHSSNNPHAAGLECGACGGQSGEISVRALAHLLNDRAVRRGLAGAGIEVPETSRFLPALHHTITDRLEVLEHAESLTSQEHQWLKRAGDTAGENRAPSLGLEQEHTTLKRRLARRAVDWAQTRPEWGLANNASFIAAPRTLTREVDLRGRSFLHDYDWRSDPSFSRLELIMTAPMIVAHWINMQYNSSTLDNRKFGSGNKVLHNVVGGRLGVFEGNGGDLRIGLPLQSLHDGKRWRHEPLRLSAYLAAPAEAIETIMKRHEPVKSLVDNGWLHLFQLDDRDGLVRAYREGHWVNA